MTSQTTTTGSSTGRNTVRSAAADPHVRRARRISIALERRLVPLAGALVVLTVLWPLLCMSGEDEPTSCKSVFIPLPWGDSADTWGMVVPIAGAVLAYCLLRWLLRPRTPNH